MSFSTFLSALVIGADNGSVQLFAPTAEIMGKCFKMFLFSFYDALNDGYFYVGLPWTYLVTSWFSIQVVLLLFLQLLQLGLP